MKRLYRGRKFIHVENGMKVQMEFYPVRNSQNYNSDLLGRFVQRKFGYPVDIWEFPDNVSFKTVIDDIQAAESKAATFALKNAIIAVTQNNLKDNGIEPNESLTDYLNRKMNEGEVI